MQKTAYGLRISDWSSDVCSSDLRAGKQPDIHARRLGRADPADPRLHRLVLLGLPRQGRRGWLSLSGAAPGPLWKRLAWFIGLWTASVAVIGTVAWFLRLWIA